jgi:large subunit ribosomal protein L22
MTGAKTNERPGTRAQVRHIRTSAYKVREVIDLIRGLPVGEAADVLRFTERGPSEVVARCLASAVANAQHNDEVDPDTLYVSACYADEGPTLKRWRPRARGRATRIRKRMSHLTIIVSPMPPEMAAKLEAKQRSAAPAAGGSRRSRRGQESRRARVARSRGEQVTEETSTEEPTDEVVEDEPTTGEPTDEMVEQAEEAAADESADEVDDEGSDDESPENDGTAAERGVEGAEGGDAEGGASTEAKDD